MSNSITYYNRYNVKDIYDIFNKNRVNKISLGTTNEYISYDVGTDYAYIYARKSSPSINSDTYKNYAYLKVDDTAYNFYCGHAYTYTETVSGQNVKPILIAYDFVNQISTQLKFNNISVSHNATAIDGVSQTVNVFSPVSYIIENDGTSKGPKNEYFIIKSDITELLGGSTFADFTTYLTYSYLDPTKYDGKVYEDGKDKLSSNSTDPINDIHVWSMSPGHDEIGFAYKDINMNANGNKKINAYAYIHCGDVVLNKLYGSDDKYIANNELLEFKYVPSAVGRPVPTGTCLGILATSGKINSETGFSYICESDNDAYGQRLYDFVKCAYSYNLGEYNDKSFSEIYTHPSYRNNNSSCEFYEFIQGKNYNYTSGEEHVGIDEIDNNNVNTTYFITNVSNLLMGILDNNITVEFRINNKILVGNIDGSDPRAGDTIDSIISSCHIETLKNNSAIETLNFYSDGTSIYRKIITSGLVWDLERFINESGNDGITFYNSNSNFTVTNQDNGFNIEGSDEYIHSIYWTFNLERTDKTKIDLLNKIKIHYKSVNNFTEAGGDGTDLTEIRINANISSGPVPESVYLSDGESNLEYENTNGHNISIKKITFVMNLPGDGKGE